MKVNHIIEMCKLMKSPLARGVTTHYYPLRKGMGVKWFKTSKERDDAYDGQALFLQDGMAPRLGRKLERSYRYKYRYGYVTQSAPVNPRKCGEVSFCGRSYGNVRVFFNPTPEVEKLLNNAHDNGRTLRDVHRKNIGWLRNRPVFIDFDDKHSTPS